ncbi:hypothetical protein BJV74DRAFT_721517, partial [Russula compacta]
AVVCRGHMKKMAKPSSINVKYLWRFITCGAIILCANNQHGVNIILPVCLSGEILSCETMTAILIQVKNDTTFNEKIWGWLFDAMDPFDINVFNQGDAPRPVIRMVFALKSKQSAIIFTPPRPSKPMRARMSDMYTAHDIWCAGLSLRIFPCMGKDRPSYQHLLDRTCHPDQYDIRKAYDVVYPDAVAAEKEQLLRHFDTLVTTRDEH